MSDPWQYRVRVTGPDRKAWWKRATRGFFGTEQDMFEWPYRYRLVGKEYGVAGTWYNVRTTPAGKFTEIFGNYSRSPGEAFSRESRLRVGPALFDGLDITAEIVGHSWHADVPGGVYSYRDVYQRGVLVLDQCEKANDASITEKYAPELLVEFPDDRKPGKIYDEEEDDEEEPDEEPETHCAHGVPFTDEHKDNGCPKCADELRSYLDGIWKRNVL